MGHGRKDGKLGPCILRHCGKFGYRFHFHPKRQMLRTLSLGRVEVGGRRSNVFPIAAAITLLNGADMDQSAQTSC